ncbi:Ubiquitin-conjugating enzyme E2 [Penicillium macrosclerotiorum]|uniref:Ubiquitin-conjugating enzyme E2 n=1 Tax=Penicillium macrosclerotiorum TaxID=303699 RepID=UPI002546731B|nr:Ubiquitin-conjugating enzyme E2 [Penicillium macrosclerotiorum]KAJ5682216.1 Ubiquitin-conjugating enzyme E2 [Penicillium macrosclerotiorum]
MVSNLRRLAADHAALHSNKLPPYYLFPPDDGRFAAPDDLSQLTLLLTGPAGTPYAQGIWRLNLKMPEDYPQSPPKATFRTRIWHPNVEELTGAVCVDTLKRDWQSKLTLRDVLVTISCLLIHPNPDSALNSSAGTLLREDYGNFAHQAKLMTSIHAPIPLDLQEMVKEAKNRGEDLNSIPTERQNESSHSLRPRKQQRLHSGIPRKIVRRTTPTEYSHSPLHDANDTMSDSENEDPASASKENNPSLSPVPVCLAPASPRKNAHGKRPLSVLSIPYPEDPDVDMMLVDSDSECEVQQTPSVTASEQNISANNTRIHRPTSPQRKSPKLTLARAVNAPFRLRDDLQIYEDVPDRTRYNADGKENCDAGTSGLREKCDLYPARPGNSANTIASGLSPNLSAPYSTSDSSHPSKVMKKAGLGGRRAGVPKPKPRIGVRRL